LKPAGDHGGEKMRGSGKNERELGGWIVSLQRRVADLENELLLARSVSDRKAGQEMSVHATSSLLDAGALLDAVPESMCVIDTDAHIQLANKVFASRYGLDDEPIIGKTMRELEIFKTDQLDAIRENVIPQVISAGVVNNVEMVGARRNGETAVVLVSFSLLRGASGEPAGIVCFGKDVTLLKKAENALKESEEQYRTLVESAGEAIASVTEEGVFTFMNATAALRLGGHAADLVGKTMWDLFPAEMADKQMSSIRDAIRTGLGLPIVQRIVDETHGKIHVNSHNGMGTTFFISLPIERK
jgi:PAS domain S-box-containing protein